MSDYKEMYFQLAAKVANAIDILVEAQQRGESLDRHTAWRRVIAPVDITFKHFISYYKQFLVGKVIICMILRF